MAIERPLQVLNLYDVFTDLIPGAVFLLFVTILFPIEGIPALENSSILILVVVIGSLVFGHIIQWIRGFDLFWKQPDVFQHTMRQVRTDLEWPHLEDNDNPGNTENSLPINMIHYEFLKRVDKRFNLNETVPDRERIQLVLSFLETRPSIRALRFQSVYSFYRSMVVVSWLAFILAVFAIIFHCTGWAPVREFPVLTGALIFSLILASASWARRNRFEKTFVGYVIREFYLEQIESGSDYPDQID